MSVHTRTSDGTSRTLAFSAYVGLMVAAAVWGSGFDARRAVVLGLLPVGLLGVGGVRRALLGGPRARWRLVGIGLLACAAGSRPLLSEYGALPAAWPLTHRETAAVFTAVLGVAVVAADLVASWRSPRT